MLEFISGVVVMTLVLTWLVRTITVKHSTTEIYGIREYVVKAEVIEPHGQDVSATIQRDKGLPSNVLRFRWQAGFGCHQIPGFKECLKLRLLSP